MRDGNRGDHEPFYATRELNYSIASTAPGNRVSRAAPPTAACNRMSCGMQSRRPRHAIT